MSDKETCDICQVNEWERVKDGYFLCYTCDSPSLGVPAFHSSVNVMGKQVKKREIDEIKRQRIVPVKAPGNDYYHGRMGDNGKIAEKSLKQY